MLSKVYSFALNGLESYPITIEVDANRGLPSTNIVGLPDSAIKESRERIRSAINNSGYEYTYDRITINLSPANTKKEGASFDLAMAVGVLSATDQINSQHLNDYVLLGELSLDGRIQPINGILTIVLSLRIFENFKGLIIPYENALEASLGNSIDIFPFKSLSEVVNFLNAPSERKPFTSNIKSTLQTPVNFDIDFSDVKGQPFVKRGLEIAAAGGHNCLMIGPPGSGKSMLAKRFQTILPDMTEAEILETTKIYSAMGLLEAQQHLIVKRPFRCPHHTTSAVAIVGGGSNPRPGEITLSHNGILFLDELPEFHRDVLESLRQPMEDQCVTISRANNSLKFPSKFILIAAMNPCPCGFFQSQTRACQCNNYKIEKYLSRISGPLLDRIDIHLHVPTLAADDLLAKSSSENSTTIKARTTTAREIQLKRLNSTHISCNAQMNHRQVKQFCPLTDENKTLLKKAIDELGLSARAYDKVLKVARTIADLASSEEIKTNHLIEAIQYRSLDRNLLNT